MKRNDSLLIVAAALALASALALVAQAAAPPDQVPSARKLQRLPVSGLHIGAPGTLKNPFAGDMRAWMQGKKLFHAMNCVGCHGPGGGGAIGPALSDKYWIYGGSPGQIYLSILHGRPYGMPQWGTTLPPQAIWELVTYIRSLPDPEFETPVPKQGTAARGAFATSGNKPEPSSTVKPIAPSKHPKPAPPPPQPAHASTTAGH